MKGSFLRFSGDCKNCELEPSLSRDKVNDQQLAQYDDSRLKPRLPPGWGFSDQSIIRHWCGPSTGQRRRGLKTALSSQEANTSMVVVVRSSREGGRSLFRMLQTVIRLLGPLGSNHN